MSLVTPQMKPVESRIRRNNYNLYISARLKLYTKVSASCIPILKILIGLLPLLLALVFSAYTL